MPCRGLTSPLPTCRRQQGHQGMHTQASQRGLRPTIPPTHTHSLRPAIPPTQPGSQVTGMLPDNPPRGVPAAAGN